jgi:hypothetical protein
VRVATLLEQLRAALRDHDGLREQVMRSRLYNVHLQSLSVIVAALVPYSSISGLLRVFVARCQVQRLQLEKAELEEKVHVR